MWSLREAKHLNTVHSWVPFFCLPNKWPCCHWFWKVLTAGPFSESFINYGSALGRCLGLEMGKKFPSSKCVCRDKRLQSDPLPQLSPQQGLSFHQTGGNSTSHLGISQKGAHFIALLLCSNYCSVRKILIGVQISTLLAVRECLLMSAWTVPFLHKWCSDSFNYNKWQF